MKKNKMKKNKMKKNKITINGESEKYKSYTDLRSKELFLCLKYQDLEDTFEEFMIMFESLEEIREEINISFIGDNILSLVKLKILKTQ